MSKDVEELLLHLQGEQLAQSMALKAILRVLPDAQRRLSEYRSLMGSSTHPSSELDPIARQSLLQTLDLITGMTAP